MSKKQNSIIDTDLQYFVRKSWEDIDSQSGIAYNFFVNAKKACDKLENYYVFDSNGNIVYPEIPVEKEEAKTMLNLGDEVYLIAGASFVSGKPIKDWVFNTKLYVRNIDGDNIAISNTKNGLTIGVVASTFLMPYSDAAATAFIAYPVAVIKNAVSIKNGANERYKTLYTVNKYDLLTIIGEKDGWGKLQGPGWINLNEVKKLYAS